MSKSLFEEIEQAVHMSGVGLSASEVASIAHETSRAAQEFYSRRDPDAHHQQWYRVAHHHGGYKCNGCGVLYEDLDDEQKQFGCSNPGCSKYPALVDTTPDSTLPYGIRPDGPETGPDPDQIADGLREGGWTPEMVKGFKPGPLVPAPDPVTLRDRFAMAAMQGLCARTENQGFERTAKMAYKQAAAMMAERERSQLHE